MNDLIKAAKLWAKVSQVRSSGCGWRDDDGDQ